MTTHHEADPASRVELVPGRLDWLTALADSDEAFTERFGLSVATGWLGFPEVRAGLADVAAPSTAEPWGTYLFFVRDTLVGFGGFKGGPRDGRVEIGYAVAPSWQGRGVATTAANAMVEIARAGGATRVLAHTLPEINPSTAVLAKCGFTQTEALPDPDGSVNGVVWRWERETS